MKARKLLTFSFFTQAIRLRTLDFSVFTLPLPKGLKKHMVLVSVAKKRVSLATKRNRIKRQIREQVRLHINNSPGLKAPSIVFIRVNNPAVSKETITKQSEEIVKKLEEKQKISSR